MKKLLLISIFSFILPSFCIFAGGTSESNEIVIGVSFSDLATERWSREDQLLRNLGAEQGARVISQSANQDTKLQNDQIENMILQGADVLIIIAQDGDTAATAVDAAASEGIPSIAYDRLIKTENTAVYLSFNNVEVGRAQARGILKRKNSGHFVLLGGSPTDNNAHLFRQGQVEALQPYLDDGSITIVADQWVENWDSANALNLMENILTAQRNNVDAVVASNDGTALGALQALKAQGLAGKVPISGQDATLAGAQSILANELTVTVYKDVRLLAPKAINIALDLANGRSPIGLVSYSLAELTLDENKKGSVDCFFFPVVEVDVNNLYEEIIVSGFQPYDEVYRNVPEDKRPARL